MPSKQPRSVRLDGTLRVGQGRENKLAHATATCPYGDRSKLDLYIAAHDRDVSLRLDRESALPLARRIIDKLEGRPLIDVL